MAKYFLSHNAADRSWADWIQHELEAMGHEVHNHWYDLRSGENFQNWMEEQLEWADFTLAIYSENYIAGKYSRREINEALHRAQSTKSNCLLIAVVRQCEVENTYASINRAHLFGKNLEAARAELQEYVGRTGLSSPRAYEPAFHNPVPFPGRVQHNLPFRAPGRFFERGELFGREDTFGKLRDLFGADRAGLCVVVLHGLAGTGKSTLAVAYAEAFRDRYRTTWWIRAGDPDSMKADLANLAVRLGWTRPDDSEDFPIDKIRDRLRREGRDLLLIYDNALDPKSVSDYLPAGGEAHVLITSNSANWRIGHEFTVKGWPPEKGGEFLVRRVPAVEGERPIAEQVSNDLEGLPLALEMAGAFCAAHHIPISRYAKMFERKLKQVFGDGGIAPEEYHSYRSAAVAFEMAIHSAVDCHPAAEQMLLHLSLLAPEAVPIDIFEVGVDRLEDRFRKDLLSSGEAGDGVDDAIRALARFSLVQWPEETDETVFLDHTDSIRLHRAVRAIVPAKLKAEERESIRGNLISVLEAAYPTVDGELTTSWNRARALFPHLLHVLGADLTPPSGHELVASKLMSRFAQFRGVSRADQIAAAALVRKALELRRMVLPPDHLLIAESLSQLSVLLMFLDNTDEKGEARRAAENAVEMCERVSGARSHETGFALIRCARVIRDIRDPDAAPGQFNAERLEKAAVCARRAVEIFADLPDDPKMGHAYAVTVLGKILTAQGNLDEAEKSIKQALQAYSRRFGAVHPTQANNLVNMAEILVAQNTPESRKEARIRFEEARNVYRAITPQHLTGIIHCDSLEAAVDEDTGQLDAARERLEVAAQLARKVYGADHEKTRGLQDRLNVVDARLKRAG